MADAHRAGLLRRIARPAPAPPPLTPERALRLAMVRTAEQSVGLHVSVLSIREEEGALDELLDRLEGDLLIQALHDGEGPAGLIALDLEGRAAVIESQTFGEVQDRPADPRPPTAADAALVRPLLTAFLREAEEAMAGTPLSGWIRAPHPGERLPGPREASLLLRDGLYRVVQLTLDLGTAGRQGLLLLMLRAEPATPKGAPEPEPTVAERALRAQTPVEAVLTRLRLPLAQAEGLIPGQVVPLPGVTVASVRLRAAALDLGPARLGQLAGMRAVRLESPLAPELGALAPPAGAQGIGMTDVPRPLPPLGEPGDGPWSFAPGAEAPLWEPPDGG